MTAPKLTASLTTEQCITACMRQHTESRRLAKRYIRDHGLPGTADVLDEAIARATAAGADQIMTELTRDESRRGAPAHWPAKDAQDELSHRSRGREARLERLRDAGWPTDHQALRLRLRQELDRQTEAAGGLFHCCTSRVSSGVDIDLPTRKRVGCRITRINPRASLVDTDEDGLRLDEPYWAVYEGHAGVGSVWTRTLPFAGPGDGHYGFDTAEAAEAEAKRLLLAEGSCARTRAEAEAMVERELALRTGAESLPA